MRKNSLGSHSLRRGPITETLPASLQELSQKPGLSATQKSALQGLIAFLLWEAPYANSLPEGQALISSKPQSSRRRVGGSKSFRATRPRELRKTSRFNCGSACVQESLPQKDIPRT